MKKVSFTSTRFDGDGRRKVPPLEQDVQPGTAPIRVTRAQARLVVRMFEERGYSSHSGMAGTLWVLLEWCRVRRVAYSLTGAATCGFYVEKAQTARTTGGLCLPQQRSKYALRRRSS